MSSPTTSVAFSKWMKHQVLLDAAEMEGLFAHLSPFTLYNVSEIVPLQDLIIETEEFLKTYRHYIESLKNGVSSFDFTTKRYFSAALTVTSEALYPHPIDKGRYMAKPLLPLIQLQQHRFFPSKEAGAFHPMVMSQESVHWGIQFAYPQIFQRGNLYTKVSDLPNTPLFTQLIQWLRKATVPTTFFWREKKIATPLRLGRECFHWINHHPQLIQQGIRVHVYS